MLILDFESNQDNSQIGAVLWRNPWRVDFQGYERGAVLGN